MIDQKSIDLIESALLFTGYIYIQKYMSISQPEIHKCPEDILRIQNMRALNKKLGPFDSLTRNEFQMSNVALCGDTVLQIK